MLILVLGLKAGEDGAGCCHLMRLYAAIIRAVDDRREAGHQPRVIIYGPHDQLGVGFRRSGALQIASDR